MDIKQWVELDNISRPKVVRSGWDTTSDHVTDEDS